MKKWWRNKSGRAKTITALAVLLLLQMGLCFASPGEPPWFDWLFRIRPNPFAHIHLGLIVVEFYLCLFTFLLLLIAVLMSVGASWSAVDSDLSVVPRSWDGTDEERTDEIK
jgi:hypothetical protein